MALSTSAAVFLGIIVQPKTKRPIYVVRAAQRPRTVYILEAAHADKFMKMGEGFLDDQGEYSFTADISGYRSETTAVHS